MSLTAPFNFVPLNKKVFFPSWEKTISHDIPFQDSQSGEINIEVLAKSPIFIRDSLNKESFCNHEGHYYIPATSVKGMVRNVLEIMSFSKMNLDMVDDDTYAIRDLRNKNLYMSKMKPENIFCGWLKKVDSRYILEDCGIPGRIHQKEIDKLYATKFSQKFEDPIFKNKPDFKTAKYKYSLLKGENLSSSFEYSHKAQNREVYKKGTQKKGTLVLTGQASKRRNSGKVGDAKIYEFIFFTKKQELEIEKSVLENFKFAYFDGRKTEPKESPDWSYWKKKLQNNEKVPLFFQKNKSGTIEHMGLSYLYKLPYTHSIHDGIPKEHSSKELDLSESIFGYVDGKDSLKGRVQFSHFHMKENAQELPKRQEILGTPRASYYPMYVLQNNKVNYATYMDNNFSLAGRKYYPVHKGSATQKTLNTGNTNVGVSFKPLKEGVVFSGKLRYHNLKKEELGALLSALTFHNTSNTYHNIGMAKSLGYGKISVNILDFDSKEYLQSYEHLMSENIPNWISSPQLINLLTMATEQENRGTSALTYMELPEFAKVKKDKQFLKLYTELEAIKKVIPQRLLQESIKAEKKEQVTKSTEGISRTKMRKFLTAKWIKIFHISCVPNHIIAYNRDTYKTIPDANALNVYTKLKEKNSKKINVIFQGIEDFFAQKLKPEEEKELYALIETLK